MTSSRTSLLLLISCFLYVETTLVWVHRFCIKMPFLHRLACFRDDLVFIVYLYQRWIYRVDPKRVNEVRLVLTVNRWLGVSLTCHCLDSMAKSRLRARRPKGKPRSHLRRRRTSERRAYNMLPCSLFIIPRVQYPLWCSRFLSMEMIDASALISSVSDFSSYDRQTTGKQGDFTRG